MTDSELLEAAAKAAGIETHGWRAHESKPGLYMLPIAETGAYLVWNPLADEGDRYRLARAAELRVDWYLCCVRAKDGTQYRWTDDGDGYDEAHAIVRAAAAMWVPSC